MSRSPTLGPVTVRELAEHDLDRVTAIESANPRPWPRTLFAEELALPAASRHWLVAEVAGTVVGFGGIMYAPDAAHLMLLGVDSVQRGRGIGTRLCLDLIDVARGRGAPALTLEVRASNRPAIALYETLGMTVAGNRPGYYPDGEDAVIFWLDDLDVANRPIGNHR